MSRHHFHAAALLAAASVGLGLSAAPASADSIVFIKDGNVWLAAPDGSKLTQVTTDGTAEFPYRSPSQADDGTIAVGHRLSIKRLRQNGEVINELDPPGLVDSTSHAVDGTPVSVAISPDGQRIAYSFASTTCPIAADCDTRATTGVTNAAAFTPPGTYASAYYGSPRWVGNDRLLVVGGYLHHINLLDVAAGSPTTHWFDDREFFGDDNDLGQGDVSADGTRVVAVHGYDGEREGTVRRMIWFNTAADPRAGALPAAKPQAVCVTGPERGTNGPNWSPDGQRLTFSTPAGIEVSSPLPRDAERCGEVSSSVVFPGAKEPDWGPADVAPTPRSGGQQEPGPGGNGGGQQQPGPGGNGGGQTSQPRLKLTQLRVDARGRVLLRVADRSGEALRVKLTVKVSGTRGKPLGTLRATVKLRRGRSADVRIAGLRSKASRGTRVQLNVDADGGAGVTGTAKRTLKVR